MDWCADRHEIICVLVWLFCVGRMDRERGARRDARDDVLADGTCGAGGGDGGVRHLMYGIVVYYQAWQSARI